MRQRGDLLVKPSRPFWPSEVPIPGFLPDIPEVRQEIAEYYSSVRRCDDVVGAILDALEASGQAESTLVVFLSDHGMALPFAKTNCYRHSTRTPLIVRWPERVKANTVDQDHFVSSIDFLPTLLEACEVSAPDGMDGQSFLALLHGEPLEGRDRVFTQFHQTSGRRITRCAQLSQPRAATFTMPGRVIRRTSVTNRRAAGPSKHATSRQERSSNR